MNLTARLDKIASLVPRGSVLADIGTDHAYIPVYCVLNGISAKALAMDINPGPLKNARHTIETYGLSDKIETRLSNGLEALKPQEADVVVIAGMGGLLIRTILDAGNLKDGTVLILQPMLAAKELREYLYLSGNGIENEYLAKEEEKMYNIIVARVGYKTDFCYDDIVIGKNIRENSPELFGAYCRKEINMRNKIIAGLKNARVTDEDAVQTVSNELTAFVRRNSNED